MRKSKSNAMLRGLASTALVLLISATAWGQKMKITYAAVDHMRRLTGVPLSIGVTMMGQGKIKRRGVFGPEVEGAVNPDEFLKELERRKIKVERGEARL